MLALKYFIGPFRLGPLMLREVCGHSMVIHSPNGVDLKVYICIAQFSVVMLTELMDMFFRKLIKTYSSTVVIFACKHSCM